MWSHYALRFFEPAQLEISQKGINMRERRKGPKMNKKIPTLFSIWDGTGVSSENVGVGIEKPSVGAKKIEVYLKLKPLYETLYFSPPENVFFSPRKDLKLYGVQV